MNSIWFSELVVGLLNISILIDVNWLCCIIMEVENGALNITESELAIHLHSCLTQQFSKLGFGYVN
jgi:hypothetical protein